jgi:hypothetical protein
MITSRLVGTSWTRMFLFSDFSVDDSVLTNAESFRFA